MAQLNSPEDALLDCIRRGLPLVLLLGQTVRHDFRDNDPVLEVGLKKLGREGQGAKGWTALIDSGGLPDNFHEWIAERFQRLPPPTWFELAAQLPWSAIFTSSIDP